MVPDDANKIVHLASTTFDMIGNAILILLWVYNKKNGF